jgi:hypothetical protein
MSEETLAIVVIVSASIIASMLLVSLALIINGVKTDRAITRALDSMTENQKWIWTRFLAILEPHIVEELQQIDEIDADLAQQSTDEPVEAETIRY